jgi:serine/threonine protein kinase
MNPGTRLDHYELVDKIGEGGMGVVWRARDTSLDREVAIKVLPASFTADASRLARFEREAKVVASLSHPNIVSIYGFGTADGVTYAAMELLQGRSLREHLDEGPLPLRKAVDVARQIASGLDAAHACGVVHRDLKPDNVFITPDGRAQILDFGLAGSEANGTGQGSGESRTRLTDPGTVVGTAGYMAPEQARGGEAGAAADIFALGVILHEMLSGGQPFHRETTAETLTAILREEPPDPTVAGSPAPPTLARIVRRCLEKSPEERFQNARDLAFALEGAVTDSGLSAPSIAAAPPRPSTPTRGSAMLATLAIAVVAFAAGWMLRPTPAEIAPPRVTELTFTGADSQPDASPDGRLIVFRSSRTGVSRVWLRQVDGGGEQPLTDGPDWRPRFAPDGQSVGFLRLDGETYSGYRVPIVGGQPRKLIENVTAIAWSPDGRELAFLRGGPSNTAGDASLGVLDLESGAERVIARYPEWELYGLSWSDDSRRIATTKASSQGGGGAWRLIVVGRDGEGLQELSVGDEALISSPTWAGSDALIYAKSATTVSGSPAPNAIMRQTLGDGIERPLLWEPYLFPLRGAFVETTFITILGNDRLVYDTARQLQTINELDIETGVIRTLVEGVSSDRQPDYSPDGSTVLFTSNRSGNVDLFAYELDTDRLVQLTEHPGGDWDGGYTPDGGSIMWSSDRGGHLEIWMSDADGANPRQVSRDGVDAENPTMTADGEWIVYSSGRPEAPGIYKVRPDGTDTTLLHGGSFTNPEVSPDGRHALFVINELSSLRNDVNVIEVDTGRLVDFEITIEYQPGSPNTTYGRGRWMPDGSAIAFIGIDDAGQPTVWIQDFVPGADTSASRRQPLGMERAGLVESFEVSPDGRRFVLSTVRTIRVLKQAEGLPPLR